MTSSLLDLAGRVERLTGPCRETDGKIKLAFAAQLFAGSATKDDAVKVLGGDLYADPLPYTASLDAAMTLVPEGLPILVRDGYDDAPDDKRPYAHVMNEIGEGYAATKALAIVVAALRARAAMEADHG